MKIAFNYWAPYFNAYVESENKYYLKDNNKRKRGDEDEERNMSMSGSKAEWQSSDYQGPDLFNQYKMWAYKGYPGVMRKFGHDDDYNEAYAHEILSSLFSQNNLEPVWTKPKNRWGWQDEETGLWNGAIGQVGYLLELLF